MSILRLVKRQIAVSIPLQAPTNFTVKEILTGTSALLYWNPVPEDSVRGELLGYKIQTWTEKDGEKGMREIDIRDKSKTNATISKFIPNTRNVARILAYNGR